MLSLPLYCAHMLCRVVASHAADRVDVKALDAVFSWTPCVGFAYRHEPTIVKLSPRPHP